MTTPIDDYSSPEPIVDLGGPILKDRLWFYVGYDPSWTKRTRTVLFNSTRQLGTFSQKPRINLINYNVSGQITRNLRGRFAASNQRDEGGYALPASGPLGVSTANPSLFPSVIRRDASNDSYSGVLDWVDEQQDVRQLDDRPGSRSTSTTSARSARRLRHVFQGSTNICNLTPRRARADCPFPEIPPSLQKVSGFADNPSSSQFVRGGLSRFNFNADITRYGNWRGQHTLKGGFQIERIVDDTLSGEQASTVQLFWNQSYALNDGRRITREVRLLQRRPLRDHRRHRVEQRRALRAGFVDAQSQAHAEPRRADRERGCAFVPRRPIPASSSTSTTRSRRASGLPTTCAATASGSSTAAGVSSTT